MSSTAWQWLLRNCSVCRLQTWAQPRSLKAWAHSASAPSRLAACLPCSGLPAQSPWPVKVSRSPHSDTNQASKLMLWWEGNRCGSVLDIFQARRMTFLQFQQLLSCCNARRSTRESWKLKLVEHWCTRADICYWKGTLKPFVAMCDLQSRMRQPGWWRPSGNRHFSGAFRTAHLHLQRPCKRLCPSLLLPSPQMPVRPWPPVTFNDWKHLSTASTWKHSSAWLNPSGYTDSCLLTLYDVVGSGQSRPFVIREVDFPCDNVSCVLVLWKRPQHHFTLALRGITWVYCMVACQGDLLWKCSSMMVETRLV